LGVYESSIPTSSNSDKKCKLKPGASIHADESLKNLRSIRHRHRRCCEAKSTILAEQFSLFHKALPKKQQRQLVMDKFDQSIKQLAYLAIAAIQAVSKLWSAVGTLFEAVGSRELRLGNVLRAKGVALLRGHLNDCILG
jgi:hypothetical protein